MGSDLFIIDSIEKFAQSSYADRDQRGVNMIIDSHAHIFPQIIAKKASDNIGKFYGLPMRYDGTREQLLEEGKRAGVDKFLINSVATTPKQVASINRFISDSVDLYPDEFIGFATLHPFSATLEEDFRWIEEHNFKGIKLHPDFQDFDIDCPEAYKIYELAQGKYPILMHMGDKRTQHSKGEKLASVTRDFEGLDFIAAHFGGYSEWANDAAYLSCTDVYVDTSSSMSMLPTYQVRQLIDIYKPEKVIFGTDYPMWDASDELELLSKVDLSEREREMILHENLENLLKKYS